MEEEEGGEGRGGGRPSRMKPLGKDDFDLATDTPPSGEYVERERVGQDDDDNVFQQALRNLNIGHAYWSEIFDEAADDLAFIYGDQWDPQVREIRRGRPCHTVNMLPKFINQVTGQARKQKFSIKVTAQSGQNSDIMVQGSAKTYPRHVVMEGAVRDIEQKSHAPYAYVRALQHSVEGGFGWLATYIVDDMENPFSRRVHVKNIRDRFSAMIDPHGTETDFSDSMWCSECRDMDEEDFKAMFGENAIPLSSNAEGIESTSGGGNYFAGAKEGVVRVAHYWYKVPVIRTAIKMQRETMPEPSPEQIEAQMAMEESGEAPPTAMQKPPLPQIERMIVWKDEVEDVLDELEAQGWMEVAKIDANTHIVKYAVLNANEILDGPHYWPSIYLPIIPVLGRYSDTRDGGEGYCGLIRHAKDTQRMVNVHFSAATEAMALKPKQFFLVTPEQIRGYEPQWNKANITGQIYLPYRHTPDGAGIPTRTSPEGMATGEIQMVMTSRGLIYDATGMYESSFGEQSNEVSAVAIQQREQQSQTTNYEFIDNLEAAVLNVGRNIVDMIPKVYNQETAQRILLADGNEVHVELNREIVDEKTGKTVRINNLDFTRYACAIDVGAETRTQKEAIFNTLMEFSRNDPETFQQVKDLAFDYAPIPGGGQAFVERLKRAQNPQLLSDEDRKKFPPLPPTPEQELQKLELEARLVEAQAKIAEAQAGVRSSELRAHSDDARREFEIAKGMNRERDSQNGEGGGLDEKKIEAIAERVANRVAGESLAKQKKK